MIGDLEFAHELADLADRITSAAFEAKDYAVRTKDDGSAVTSVDVGVEESLAERVARAYPHDGFLSEELGLFKAGDRPRRWIVDGIDGTGSFVEGGSTWGTLIALEQGGEIELGVASSPGLQRRWWASRGAGAWSAALEASGQSATAVRLAVSSSRSAEPRGAVLPPPGLLDGWREDVINQAKQALRRPERPGHGPLLVAAGDIDVSVHLWGGPWDHAPFVVLVEEAGGRFSDLWNGRRIDTATAIFSNGLVHDAIREPLVAVAPRGPEPLADD